MEYKKDRFLTKYRKTKEENIYSNILKKLLDVKDSSIGLVDLLTKENIKEIEYKNKRIEQISKYPTRVLDAPQLLDDFYINIMDWCLSEEILAVGLDKGIYFWNETTETNFEFFKTEEEQISCLKFISIENMVACYGNSIDVFDVSTQKRFCSFSCGETVFSLSREIDGFFMTGSQDGFFNIYEKRQQNPISIVNAHSSGICSIEYSKTNMSIATGSNDRKVKIWDTRMLESPSFVFSSHTAAVRAIDWCPGKRNTIATGGGWRDQRIMIWSSLTGNVLDKVGTGNQVCLLKWSTLGNSEILSVHGNKKSFGNHPLTLWKVPGTKKILELFPHKERITQMAVSKSGKVATGAPNETIKLWDLF